ncbi:MAG TPA: hypothetical protein VJI75_01605 [Candidatus Nanoarchaeia archaeon]|nr:hypothetical protein [Candidatus Nanoarchaeia archaeon]
MAKASHKSKKGKKPQQKSGMSARRLIVLVIAFFIVFCVFTASAYLYLNQESLLFGVEKVFIVPAMMEIGDRVGVNADNDVMNFGIIPQGSASFRTVNVTNTHDYRLRLAISSEGNISSMLSFVPKQIIPPRSSVEVSISAGAPASRSSSKYSGNVTFTFFKES